ncbi:cupin domain-containing protein [Cypionkella sp.]|jgi:uncharacterized cupin superfamily protein|uniref:cupin domain-containing protein n=1 Tax=Cypionkella sp. TaxID=2811411 RepID=UPI00271F38E8|nr:cupin domain-containing protein [Cypionkella sp.]MDO8983674.1 cupin domain-containing protein [Cypionkella sp.]MDP1578243.1 cupin domain-containing protein [Cypionkella sp.]MDP2050091.1 cupin domain-containing protein [Cypionkella sp.]
MVVPIRFSSSGPTGWGALADVPLDHAELLAGLPLGQDFSYFQRPEAKLRAGIWRSTAYTEHYENYPCDEFMIVLEGEVTLENDEICETYRKGDAFLVPKGFKGIWRQPVAMLKFYVIVE